MRSASTVVAHALIGSVAAPPAEQKIMMDRWIAEKRLGNKNRLFIGKTSDRSSAMTLSDAEGRPRILMQVKPGGEAAIQFLDEAGKVVKTVSPTAG